MLPHPTYRTSKTRKLWISFVEKTVHLVLSRRCVFSPTSKLVPRRRDSPFPFPGIPERLRIRKIVRSVLSKIPPPPPPPPLTPPHDVYPRTRIPPPPSVTTPSTTHVIEVFHLDLFLDCSGLRLTGSGSGSLSDSDERSRDRDGDRDRDESASASGSESTTSESESDGEFRFRPRGGLFLALTGQKKKGSRPGSVGVGVGDGDGIGAENGERRGQQREREHDRGGVGVNGGVNVGVGERRRTQQGGEGGQGGGPLAPTATVGIYGSFFNLRNRQGERVTVVDDDVPHRTRHNDDRDHLFDDDEDEDEDETTQHLPTHTHEKKKRFKLLERWVLRLKIPQEKSRTQTQSQVLGGEHWLRVYTDVTLLLTSIWPLVIQLPVYKLYRHRLRDRRARPVLWRFYRNRRRPSPKVQASLSESFTFRTIKVLSGIMMSVAVRWKPTEQVTKLSLSLARRDAATAGPVVGGEREGEEGEGESSLSSGLMDEVSTSEVGILEEGLTKFLQSTSEEDRRDVAFGRTLGVPSNPIAIRGQMNTPYAQSAPRQRRSTGGGPSTFGGSPPFGGFGTSLQDPPPSFGSYERTPPFGTTFPTKLRTSPFTAPPFSSAGSVEDSPTIVKGTIFGPPTPDVPTMSSMESNRGSWSGRRFPTPDPEANRSGVPGYLRRSKPRNSTDGFSREDEDEGEDDVVFPESSFSPPSDVFGPSSPHDGIGHRVSSPPSPLPFAPAFLTLDTEPRRSSPDSPFPSRRRGPLGSFDESPGDVGPDFAFLDDDDIFDSDVDHPPEDGLSYKDQVDALLDRLKAVSGLRSFEDDSEVRKVPLADILEQLHHLENQKSAVLFSVGD